MERIPPIFQLRFSERHFLRFSISTFFLIGFFLHAADPHGIQYRGRSESLPERFITRYWDRERVVTKTVEESKHKTSGPGPGSQLLEEGVIVSEETCGNPSAIHRSLKALDCSRPILRTVRLKPPSPNVLIVPSVAQVRRCVGHCIHPRSCLPLKTTKVRVQAYKFDQTNSSSGQTCVEYELEEHEKCGCACAVESRHCFPSQVYDSHACACKCPNHEEKLRCLERQFEVTGPPLFLEKVYWKEESCECRLAENPEAGCRPWESWNRNLNRCMLRRRQDNEEENALF